MFSSFFGTTNNSAPESTTNGLNSSERDAALKEKWINERSVYYGSQLAQYREMITNFYVSILLGKKPVIALLFIGLYSYGFTLFIKAQWLSLLLNLGFIYFIYDILTISQYWRRMDLVGRFNSAIRYDQRNSLPASALVDFNALCVRLATFEFYFYAFKSNFIALRSHNLGLYALTGFILYCLLQAILLLFPEVALCYLVAYGLIFWPAIQYYRIIDRLLAAAHVELQPLPGDRSLGPDGNGGGNQSVRTLFEILSEKASKLYAKYQESLRIPEEIIPPSVPGTRPQTTIDPGDDRRTSTISVATVDTFKDVLPSPKSTLLPGLLSWVTTAVVYSIAPNLSEKKEDITYADVTPINERHTDAYIEEIHLDNALGFNEGKSKDNTIGKSKLKHRGPTKEESFEYIDYSDTKSE